MELAIEIRIRTMFISERATTIIHNRFIIHFIKSIRIIKLLLNPRQYQNAQLGKIHTHNSESSD